ncbi:putative disease resistance RPP13-like protein 1 [Momordica charantia]|uniref:Disease resistance RPP13-like protein 1 n=1 Tax=Momordica charantia TaxID=3673 RepID=A0A6J1CTK8_MOMCH|nr:putative disease resistance RPP13-like protein 1 [Momordica charantia]
MISISLQDGDLVLSILKLSVDRLPSFLLNQCFAYCSNFSKGFKFQKEELIQMWMAQGFIIQPQDGRNLVIEDIGDKYFNIVLSRSLFQDVVKDERGRITHCKMHDLIYEIACTISHSKKLHSGHANLLEEGSCTNWSRKSVVNLRTFICDGQMLHEMIHDRITNCFRLRVLILNSSVQNLPDSIGKMKHLRYLDISDSKIKEIRYSFSLLYNLQTLKLGRSTKNLPNNLSKLVSLRHLQFPILNFTEKTKQMPPHLSRLTQLQTLSGFVVGFENGCKIEELGPLKNLKGRLELSNLEHIKSKEEAMTSKLVEKKNLNELLFEWDLHILREGSINNNNDLEVLEGLQPHQSLQFLSIKNFAGQFLPSGIFVENLVVIHLRHCERCEILPMLGQLSNLEELNISSLNRVRSIGNEFYGNDATHLALFPKLKKFVLSQMYSLEQWEELVVASNDAIFPRLEDLNIRGCPKLTSIPNIFGSSSHAGVRNFRSLHIYGCEYLWM